jgi:sensor histidine kinase YesM
MEKIYTPRFDRKYLYLLSQGLYVVVGIITYQINIVMIKGLFSVLSIFIISFFLFQTTSIKKMVIQDFIFWLYLIIVDVIALLLLSLSNEIMIGAVIDDPRLLFISSSANAILFLGSFRLFVEGVKEFKRDFIGLQQNILLLLLAIFEIMLLVYLLILNDHVENGGIQIIICLVFIFLDGYLIYLFESIAKKNHLKQEVFIAKKQVEMQNTYYKTIESQYDESQRLIHDMKNHLQTLKSLYLLTEIKEEAAEYDQIILQKIEKLGNRFKCDNRVLTIIMNDKIRKCDENNIVVKIDMENMDLDFISAFDLTTIFTNLFDNAIEASLAVSVQKRFIQIRMFRFNDFLMINFLNFYVSVPVVQNKHLVSTKEEERIGFGISNVKMALEKYHGEMEYDYEGNEFLVKIVIPIKKG